MNQQVISNRPGGDERAARSRIDAAAKLLRGDKSKVPDDFVYKILDLMEKNKDDLVSVQPVLREWTPAFGYKQYGVPYHPGALKFFKERNLTAQPLG